ncbi:MAG: peptidoglycan-associated lipoprotein Pal [bacterium]
MTHRIPWLIKGTIIVAALSFAGCGKKTAAPVQTEVATTPSTPAKPDNPTPPSRDESTKYVDPMTVYPGVFVAIRFEFDKYEITDAAKPVLEKIAAALKEKPTWKVLIEGHCDERGTNEYNMGLGEQRAQAAKRYLVSLGVEESRFQTVSYGEERPIDPGHDETAWVKNRRAEFKVEAPRT